MPLKLKKPKEDMKRETISSDWIKHKKPDRKNHVYKEKNKISEWLKNQHWAVSTEKLIIINLKDNFDS